MPVLVATGLWQLQHEWATGATKKFGTAMHGDLCDSGGVTKSSITTYLPSVGKKVQVPRTCSTILNPRLSLKTPLRFGGHGTIDTPEVLSVCGLADHIWGYLGSH